jgi:hypothetical protein
MNGSLGQRRFGVAWSGPSPASGPCGRHVRGLADEATQAQLDKGV